MPKLLFVDDDKDILNFNCTHFKRIGYEIFRAANARDAMRIISSVMLDCVILDIDMPGIDGFDLCRRLRETSGIPVIFLSALTEEEIRVKSFLVGGDDYLAKPYNMKELELRVKSRMQGQWSHTEGRTHQFGALQIDTGRRTITYEGTVGEFTALQFDVLAFLANHPGQVFSYEQIYDRVWKSPIMGSRHNLQVVIATVRQKLISLCGGQNYIETIPRKGYRFIELPTAEKEGIE